MAYQDYAVSEEELPLKVRLAMLEEQVKHLGCLIENLIHRMKKVDGEEAKA